MEVVGIIPARLQSSRLPRKLLLDQTGKPLIQYTWEAACRADALSEVIVATDSAQIAAVVREFGGRCEMTGEHASGTDRVAEVVRRSCPEADMLVNIQGDEPEIDPSQIDVLVTTLLDHPSAEMATLATPITTAAVRDDPSCTKVVCAADGRALYFSRSPIPHCRDADPDEFFPSTECGSPNAELDAEIGAPAIAGHPKSEIQNESPWLLHLGIYAYRREFLLELTGRPASRLEQLEKLEQLRALEAGATIQVAVVEHRSVGIDTPDDYARFREKVKRKK